MAKYFRWNNYLYKEFEMRAITPMYDGDSIIHTVAGRSENRGGGMKQTGPQVNLTQRNNNRDAAESITMAQSGRTGQFASALRSVFAALANWSERGEQQRREAFLADSRDTVELEYRLRLLERRGLLFHRW